MLYLDSMGILQTSPKEYKSSSAPCRQELCPACSYPSTSFEHSSLASLSLPSFVFHPLHVSEQLLVSKLNYLTLTFKPVFLPLPSWT